MFESMKNNIVIQKIRKESCSSIWYMRNNAYIVK